MNRNNYKYEIGNKSAPYFKRSTSLSALSAILNSISLHHSNTNQQSLPLTTFTSPTIIYTTTTMFKSKEKETINKGLPIDNTNKEKFDSWDPNDHITNRNLEPPGSDAVTKKVFLGSAHPADQENVGNSKCF